ncbi:MAG: nucleoside triphosphate pyrophosphohydrolase [Porticoccaceae bacterium]|nr:nucleoside triphosphate pyrophosphohydrolase [Porticoccaceae bacterium]
MSQTYTIEDLIYLMSRLRDPDTGCPWDCEQDFRSLTPYTIEEVYEVVDTIERGDIEHLSEELGDLLFQVVFYARVAEEQQQFDFNDIVNNIVGKLVSRHPHVFPDGTLHSERRDNVQPGQEAINAKWEELKQQERARKGNHGLLADIPPSLPALARAQKVQKRAAKVGFDWQGLSQVVDKIDEEIEELKQALSQGSSENIADEIGDLLFTAVNLARHAGFDAESLMRQATGKFESRFSLVEGYATAADQPLTELSPGELDTLWRRAKRQ